MRCLFYYYMYISSLSKGSIKIIFLTIISYVHLFLNKVEMPSWVGVDVDGGEILKNMENIPGL